MTDNCEELRNSLKRAWPNSTLLLCIFHILQQVWRWLFEKEHGVSKYDRVEIMKSFRKLVYSTSKEEFEENYEELVHLDAFESNECCIQYFQDLCTIESAWALWCRKEYLTRGSNTNNYVEAQFLVVKDGILKRQRQYNINQLLDKLINEFEEHFKTKLLSVADGTFDGVYSGRFKGLKLEVPGILNLFWSGFFGFFCTIYFQDKVKFFLPFKTFSSYKGGGQGV